MTYTLYDIKRTNIFPLKIAMGLKLLHIDIFPFNKAIRS